MYNLLRDLKSRKYFKQKPFDYCDETKKFLCIKLAARSKHILIELGYYFVEREN